MNRVILVGRLTKDPVVREIESLGKSVAAFHLAVNSSFGAGKNTVDYIPIVVWGKQAEAVGNYLKKGSLVSVSGKIRVKSYQKENDLKGYITEVMADQVQFLTSSKKADNTETQTFNSDAEELSLEIADKIIDEEIIDNTAEQNIKTVHTKKGKAQ